MPARTTVLHEIACKAEAGVVVDAAILEVLRLARDENRAIVLVFNDVRLDIEPTATLEEVLKMYRKALQPSPEDIASTIIFNTLGSTTSVQHQRLKRAIAQAVQEARDAS